MNKKLEIEIGSELSIINGIGFFLTIFGILVLLISGFVLFTGSYLPLEIKVIYFFDVVSRNFYLTFLTSVLTIIIGNTLISLRKYESTYLDVYDDKMVFHKQNERIELLNTKIHKFLSKKNSWTGKKRLNIKTIGLKNYEAQMNRQTFDELTNLYSEKLL